MIEKSRITRVKKKKLKQVVNKLESFSLYKKT